MAGSNLCSVNGSAGQSAKAGSSRLADIDIAKGLAIVLVIFGHIVARQPPADNGWYVVTKEALYSFHMAFFMFLSGIVYFLNIRIVASWKEFGVHVGKRFMRLMPAYFLFAGVVFLAKWSAQSFMHVDNPVNGWSDLIGIVFYPMQSISAFLWFIYVLFLFCVAGLALFSLVRGHVLPMVVLGAILLFVPKTPFLGMDQFCKYFLFFSLGGLAIRHWARYCTLVDRTWVAATVAFILMLATANYRGDGWIPTALLSLIALHGLCRKQIPFAGLLMYLGLMTLPIYLMNTLSIGFVKAVMLKFVSWDGINFFMFAPILIVAGLWVPILVKRHLIRRVRWLDRITS